MGKDLAELASYFLPLAENLIDTAMAQGLDPIVITTGRTPEEQKVKVAQGVSWTQRSKHLPQPPEQKSEAIDLVPYACMVLKFWGWNGTVENSHPHWGKLIQIARGLGLKCGADFPTLSNGRVPSDPGHFEYVKPLDRA